MYDMRTLKKCTGTNEHHAHRAVVSNSLSMKSVARVCARAWEEAAASRQQRKQRSGTGVHFELIFRFKNERRKRLGGRVDP